MWLHFATPATAALLDCGRAAFAVFVHNDLRTSMYLPAWQQSKGKQTLFIVFDFIPSMVSADVLRLLACWLSSADRFSR